MQLGQRPNAFRCLPAHQGTLPVRPAVLPRSTRARCAVAGPETLKRTLPEDLVDTPAVQPDAKAAPPQAPPATAPAAAAPVAEPAAQAKPHESPAENAQNQPSEPAVHSESQPAAVHAEAPKAKDGYRSAVMIQAYGWDSCLQEQWYNQVAAKAKDMKAAGFTHVWMPPPSQSVSPQGFMPGQLYNLTSKYGNAETLTSCIQAIKGEGMKAVADIVINHRCADEKSKDGVYNNYRDDVSHSGKRLDWDAWAITGDDPKFKGRGNPDTGDDYEPAPDLDHANPELRAALVEWLQHLRDDIGFEGLRLDFAKGYAAEFVKEYIDSSVTAQNLNVGEVWVDCKWNDGDLDHNQDEARQKLCDWIKGNGESCTAFDFPTKGIMNEVIKHTQYNRLRDSQGKAPGLMGWWPAMAVTFISNHDTDSTENHWPIPPEGVEAANAYILTHPGIPCVFWDHMFKWGPDMNKAITTLMSVRQRNGIVSDSKLEILKAEHDMYVARVADRVLVKLGPGMDMGDLVPNKEEGWAKAGSGNDWAVWEKK